jgi:ribonuclease HI
MKGIVSKSPWLFCCDEAWGNNRAGVATILISPSRIKLCYTTRLQLTNKVEKFTNNIAEYKAILLGLCKLRVIGVQTCTLHTDSKVVASQIEKECIAREPTLKRYLALIGRMDNHFKCFIVEYIEIRKNSKADELAKAVARNTPLPTDVFFQIVLDASMKIVKPEPRIINLIEGEDWHMPIMAYLRYYYESDNTTEHTRMQ